MSLQEVGKNFGHRICDKTCQFGVLCLTPMLQVSCIITKCLKSEIEIRKDLHKIPCNVTLNLSVPVHFDMFFFHQMICYGNLTIGIDEEAQISSLKSVLKCVFAFEVSLTQFNSNFVLFTGNYFNSGICSRVLCQILGSWLSQCVRRD